MNEEEFRDRKQYNPVVVVVYIGIVLRWRANLLRDEFKSAVFTWSNYCYVTTCAPRWANRLCTVQTLKWKVSLLLCWNVVVDCGSRPHVNIRVQSALLFPKSQRGADATHWMQNCSVKYSKSPIGIVGPGLDSDKIGRRRTGILTKYIVNSTAPALFKVRIASWHRNIFSSPWHQCTSDKARAHPLNSRVVEPNMQIPTYVPT